MFDLFATILAWFYAITHNYAIAIALLTLCVMIVLTPLTLKGTKSMLQLQKLQPQVKRLQAEHKGDRQKLNEEMMALYKENRINPLSGCLPLLLQAPIFFILYRVLSGLTRTCPSDGEIGGVSCASVGVVGRRRSSPTTSSSRASSSRAWWARPRCWRSASTCPSRPPSSCRKGSSTACPTSSSCSSSGP